MPVGVRAVYADRDRADALTAVLTESWDIAVDVSRQPGQVRRAVTALADRCRHYVFVSTGSVYSDHSQVNADETTSLLEPLPGEVMTSMEEYGRAKVACEQHVLAAFGDARCLIARCGLIAGPGDDSGRTGYWPLRFAHPASPDGAVLVPETAGRTCQMIDVRDLAWWLIRAGTLGTSGIFDVVGETWPLADYLQEARRVAGHTGELISAPDQWLTEHGIEEWMGDESLPLWIHEPDWSGFTSRSGARAQAAGLTTRPLAETLADLLVWEEASGIDRPRRAGLSAATERTLLDELRSAR